MKIEGNGMKIIQNNKYNEANAYSFEKTLDFELLVFSLDLLNLLCNCISISENNVKYTSYSS
jgi:hypothetical protein